MIDKVGFSINDIKSVWKKIQNQSIEATQADEAVKGCSSR